ncbi:hypothetical protein AAF712_012904 [Marasmius tenuissimus]|uniref:Uncharacterized protein n=1 Tax=Marasmius tenuissimus TaxID=585030 RepID=A0ABR2ZG67_9AGAR
MSTATSMTPRTTQKKTLKSKKKVLDLTLLTMDDALETSNLSLVHIEQPVKQTSTVTEPKSKRKVLDASKLEVDPSKPSKPKKSKSWKATFRPKYPQPAESTKHRFRQYPTLPIAPKLRARIQQTETTLPSTSSPSSAQISPTYKPKQPSPLSHPTRNMVRVLSIQMARQLSSGWHVTEVVLV